MIAPQLEKILNNTKGEREIAEYLKANPWILLRAVVCFGDACYLVDEFPLGNEYRADFVAFAPFSGGWEIRFIELEPPDASIFNQDGTLAKKMNKANLQIDTWRHYITKNRDIVLRDLSRYAQNKDLVRGKSESKPTCHVGWPMYHPRSAVSFRFDIVIGRRADLTDKQLELKGSFKDNHKINIMTYDRLIEKARDIDNLGSRHT